jgi:hypothetical protein
MKKFLSIFVLALLVLPFTALALPSEPGVQLPLVMGTTQDLFDFIRIALNWIFYALLILAVIYILLIAINYVMVGGKDPKAVAGNGQKLGFIIIGIVVALLAKGLIYLTCYLITGGQTCRF